MVKIQKRKIGLRLLWLVAIVANVCPLEYAWATIYQWTDRTGHLHFSDHPPQNVEPTVIDEEPKVHHKRNAIQTAMAAQQMAITSFSIHDDPKMKGYSLASVIIKNNGDAMVEPVQCNLDYARTAPTDSHGNPIITQDMERDANGAIKMKTESRYAHPAKPTAAQLDAEANHRHTPEYERTHPDGRNRIHSVLPGQEAECRFSLISTQIERATVTVEWLPDPEDEPVSTTQTWAK